ncbi:hypothetical protein Poly24_29260 [Rosistilla carotiformis]|uniref:Uncharacterized protein n=1 Tax=Rosistilla carotiformis TaxID=2528017 RepID=A0A518JUI2_9BACT|nr:hypothetical protein Poly24_29260 [Rosistilla carotiformis]
MPCMKGIARRRSDRKNALGVSVLGSREYQSMHRGRLQRLANLDWKVRCNRRWGGWLAIGDILSAGCPEDARSVCGKPWIGGWGDCFRASSTKHDHNHRGTSTAAVDPLRTRNCHMCVKLKYSCQIGTRRPDSRSVAQVDTAIYQSSARLVRVNAAAAPGSKCRGTASIQPPVAPAAP